MGAAYKGGQPSRCRLCNVVGVGMGRSSRKDGAAEEPVLTILVKNKTSAEAVASSCPAIRGLTDSRGIEVLEVGNIVALPK